MVSLHRRRGPPRHGSELHRPGVEPLRPGEVRRGPDRVREALAISSRTRGEDDAETGTSCNSLAVTLNAQGKYAEAQPWLEKALAIIRRNLREDHLETARSYHNLAYNLHGQGKYAEAEALYRKALAIWRGQLGEDHPKTAVTYNNLAINLHDSGKYAEAELIFEKALRCQRDKLGEDHPDTALTYRSLAVNRNAQGKYAEAEATALAAARSYEAARLRISLAGLQRAEFASKGSPLAVLAALLARRGRGQDAWIRWEAELRGACSTTWRSAAARPSRPTSGAVATS